MEGQATPALLVLPWKGVLNVNKPDAAALLDAVHLEAMEAAVRLDLTADDPIVVREVPVEPPAALTLEDAVDALRRIGYHQRQIAEVRAEVDRLVAPLKALVDQYEAWGKEQTTDRERRIAMHEGRLVAFYKLNPPAKTLTLKLPGGKVSKRNGQPKWDWQDEAALLDALGKDHPAVTLRPVLDKTALKKQAEVLENGGVMNPETGEVLPGVRVVPQPDTYKVEVE